MNKSAVRFACKSEYSNEYADVDPLNLCITHEDSDLLFEEQKGSHHSRSPPIGIPDNSPNHAFQPICPMEYDMILSLCRRVRALEQQVENMKRQVGDHNLMLQAPHHRQVGCVTCCCCCCCCAHNAPRTSLSRSSSL